MQCGLFMKKSQQKTSFGLVAKQYQKYRRSYDPKLYKLLFSLLPQKELVILDVGCGTGKSTEPLFVEAKKHQISVVGIDPDESMLYEARLSAKKKKLSIEYIKGTAEKLPFEKEKFDAVISGAAFHWFGSKGTIKKIKNTLKKGGVFFVFWAQYVKSNKPTIGADLYEKYNWQGIPKKFRGQGYVAELLSETGFKKVRKVAIPFIEKKTISEMIGNLKTNSSYALMSPNIKKQFVKEMTNAYKDALGNKRYDINELELRICYGFK
jgi:ubiquinone/menaquinone biosynthesis C-methylase UbiE